MLIFLGLPTIQKSVATYSIAGSLEALSLTASPCGERILAKYFFSLCPLCSSICSIYSVFFLNTFVHTDWEMCYFKRLGESVVPFLILSFTVFSTLLCIVPWQVINMYYLGSSPWYHFILSTRRSYESLLWLSRTAKRDWSILRAAPLFCIWT